MYYVGYPIGVEHNDSGHTHGRYSIYMTW